MKRKFEDCDSTSGNTINELQTTTVVQTKFEDLPDEVLLRIFFFVEIRDLIHCGQVGSKRIRTISNDSSLWEKVSLPQKRLPIGLIEKVFENECEYLKV